MATSSFSNLHGKQTQEHDEEDDDLVILPNVDNSELIAQFKLSLVGRIFNTERRSVEALITLLPRPNIWDVEGRVRGLDLGNHRFQFDFESESDLVKVLNKRPCHFNKWAFALERWIPHVGDTFPNTMTFWISFSGIPTHFWMDPIFESLGGRLGNVGPIDARAAKVQVEINMDRPLRFALRAQLPTGEIVPVKLAYANLHRYCTHCRLVSHEVESCPQLSEAERKEKSSSLNDDRDLPNFNRLDNQRKGETSKRTLPQPSKDRRSGEVTHRDTRDSVWKRIDSRYDPRADPRPSSRYEQRQDNKTTDRQRDPPPRDTYNKRRYDESFQSSKQREASRREKDKGKGSVTLPSNPAALVVTKETRREPLEVEALPEQSAPLLATVPARQDTVSPELNRDRPFRLNLQKKGSSNLKLKEKMLDEDEVSDEGSSARKSLDFTVSSAPILVNPIPLAKDSTFKEPTKSWYEMTLEEEGSGTGEAMNTKTPPQASDNMEKSTLPLTEIILEEEDWLEEGNEFGDAEINEFGEEDIDMMEEDDLLGEELLIEEEQHLQIDDTGNTRAKETATLEVTDSSGADKVVQSAIDSKNKTPLKVMSSSSEHLSASPASAKKKRGSRSPSTFGVSLRHRNLTVGLGSPKPVSPGLNGPKLKQSGPSPSDNQRKARVAALPKKINSKVANGRPPKAP